MTKHTLTIYRPDQDCIIVMLDNEVIGNFEYAEMGFAGVASAVGVVRTIAEILGFRIKDEED